MNGSEAVENITSQGNRSLMMAFFILPSFYEAYNNFLYVMIAFGIAGNLLVLIVFIRHPPTTTTDWFILFITSYDFTTSVVNTPIYVTFTNGYWRRYGTTTICQLHMFISQSVVLSSAFLIAGLALDRYLKVCRQTVSFSKTKARNICILISFLTVILSTPCFVMYENRYSRCVSIIMDSQLFAYYMIVFLVFVLASVTVVLSYYKVTQAVIKSEKNILKHKGKGHHGPGGGWWFVSAFRRSKVAPSTTQVSRSGLFVDTVLPSKDTELSGRSEVSRDVINECLDEPPKTEIQRLSIPRPVSRGSPTPGPNTGLSDIAPRQKSTANLTEDIRTRSPDPTNLHSASAVSFHADSCAASTHTQPQQTNRLVSLRTTKISFLVCSIFIITWIPPWISFILASVPGMTQKVEVVKFMIFGKMTYLLNTTTNPIVYIWLNKKFRRNILNIFCCKPKRRTDGF